MAKNQETPATTQTILADGTIELSGGGGVVRLRHMAKGIIYGRFTGQCHHGFCPVLEAEMKRAIAAATPCYFFIDTTEQKGYDTEYRVFWTEFFRKHRRSLGPIHVLVMSRVIVMGIAVVNMAIGEELLRSFVSRQEFERVMDELIRSRKTGALFSSASA